MTVIKTEGGDNETEEFNCDSADGVYSLLTHKYNKIWNNFNLFHKIDYYLISQS